MQRRFQIVVWELDENLEPVSRQLVLPTETLFDHFRKDLDLFLRIQVPENCQHVKNVQTFTRGRGPGDADPAFHRAYLTIDVEVEGLTKKRTQRAFSEFRSQLDSLADSLGAVTWKVVHEKSANDGTDLWVFEMDFGHPLWILEILLSEEVTFQDCLHKVNSIEEFVAHKLLPVVNSRR